MSEFYQRYYPTACLRRAEMRALEKLPLSEKSAMLPIILLAPWLNSIDFENTHKRVKKSTEGTKIIVDLDRYFKSSSDMPSRVFFNLLQSGDPGVLAWMELVSTHESYIPTILFSNVSDAMVKAQIDWARNLKRGFAFRVEPVSLPEFPRILSAIEACKDDDVIVIFDYGYRDDILATTSDVSAYVRKILAISEDLKVIVTGADFPNNFSDYDDFSESKMISSRGIYRELLKTLGNYKLYYGDWSSTKPRRYDGGGSRPLPRIDFPTKNSWIIARSKEGQWTFEDAARQIVRLSEWESRPLIWGTGMIERTAAGLPGGITTGPEAIAVRVNIHLYTQNHFGDEAAAPAPEGAWVDPI